MGLARQGKGGREAPTVLPWAEYRPCWTARVTLSPPGTKQRTPEGAWPAAGTGLNDITLQT